MSFDEDFISRVVIAFDKTMKETKKFPDREGMERQFRHFLATFLFGDVLGWKGHYQIAEIVDITCFDDEKFPIIVVETKWGVELTSEMKEKLRRRVEELGSVKYGVLTNERDFIVYKYADYKLEDITKIKSNRVIVDEKLELGLETLTGAGAVSVSTPVTFLVTTAADALTLANGYNGQLKIIYMVTDGGDGTLTPTNLTGYTTVTFDAIYEYWIGIFYAGSWRTILTNATLA